MQSLGSPVRVSTSTKSETNREPLTTFMVSFFYNRVHVKAGIKTQTNTIRNFNMKYFIQEIFILKYLKPVNVSLNCY